MKIAFLAREDVPVHIETIQTLREGAARKGHRIVPVADADCLAGYGWHPPAGDWAARARGGDPRPVITCDLAYFGREEAAERRWVKVSVNDPHPTTYFQRRPKDAARFSGFGIPLLPERINPAGAVVIAASGPKSSARDGLEFQGWERAAIQHLRQHTDRPLVYRPKPYMKAGAPQPLEGAAMDLRKPVDLLLRDAWAVVTRQSNVAVDALRCGLPVFAEAGVASVLGLKDLGLIEAPWRPSEAAKVQFFADLAWCQFRLAELRSGFLWDHLAQEGLLPC